MGTWGLQGRTSRVKWFKLKWLTLPCVLHWLPLLVQLCVCRNAIICFSFAVKW